MNHFNWKNLIYLLILLSIYGCVQNNVKEKKCEYCINLLDSLDKFSCGEKSCIYIAGGEPIFSKKLNPTEHNYIKQNKFCLQGLNKDEVLYFFEDFIIRKDNINFSPDSTWMFVLVFAEMCFPVPNSRKGYCCQETIVDFPLKFKKEKGNYILQLHKSDSLKLEECYLDGRH